MIYLKSCTDARKPSWQRRLTVEISFLDMMLENRTQKKNDEEGISCGDKDLSCFFKKRDEVCQTTFRCQSVFEFRNRSGNVFFLQVVSHCSESALNQWLILIFMHAPLPLDSFFFFASCNSCKHCFLWSCMYFYKDFKLLQQSNMLVSGDEVEFVFCFSLSLFDIWHWQVLCQAFI